MPLLPLAHASARRSRASASRLASVLVLIAAVVVAALGPADSAFSAGPAAGAARTCTVPNVKKLTLKQATAKLGKAGCGKPNVKRDFSSTIRNGRIISQSPNANKRVRGGTRVTVVVSRGKGCVVKARNKKGKLVTVYLTKIVTVHGKKKRVFVYRFVTKNVHGKKTRVKVKIPKVGPCKSGKKKAKSAGIPVTINIIDPSAAHLDFGGFARDVPLSGVIKGFIVGKGFVLGQDNQIQLSSGKINLAPTGIFIDDVCNGQVSDAIRIDPHSFAEIDQATTGNQVNVAPNSTITGLVHLRIQTALQLRNDDTGCNNPYITTGWTDFTVPLFLRGKLGAGKGGLVSTLSTGETVLDQLSACLAPGNPTIPCNGFAIPFPAILTSQIVGVVHIGQ